MNIATLAAETGKNASDASGISGINTNSSLDDMLWRAVGQLDATAESATSHIKQGLAKPGAFSPERLAALQAEALDYGIQVSLASTLARKGIAVIETVVKGQ